MHEESDINSRTMPTLPEIPMSGRTYIPFAALLLLSMLVALFYLPENMHAAHQADSGADGGATDAFCLSVSDAAGEAVLQKPLAEHERFILRHRHSVHRSLVVEYLGPGPDGTIRILEGQYADYGAGLPQKAEKGQRLEFSGGKARLFPAPADLRRIEVRVGREAEHTVIHRDREYPLAGLIPPGMTAVFSISGAACPRAYP